ncbi:MAG: hypothetical protein JW951_01855, partial [Lentisphaerae bacterium]|nr:hypothetical protein [Lentisphaerota bacterium]
QRETVLLLYGVAFVFALGAVVQHFIPPEAPLAAAPYAVYLATIAAVCWRAGYLRRPEAARAMLARRARNAALHALGRYAITALTPPDAPVEIDDILRMVRRQARLQFVEAWYEEDEVLIGAAGGAAAEAADPLTLDPVERVRVRAANGKRVVIRFRFDHKPEITEVDDISACLAHIFEYANLRRRAAAAPGRRMQTADCRP